MEIFFNIPGWLVEPVEYNLKETCLDMTGLRKYYEQAVDLACRRVQYLTY